MDEDVVMQAVGDLAARTLSPARARVAVPIDRGGR
jgi:hypothetical protein